MTSQDPQVLCCGDLAADSLGEVLAAWGLELVTVADDAALPGSFWGAPEAGIRGHQVFVRRDTPVHSALHEACHLVLATVEGRGPIDTDAGGDYAEEDAVCLLQVLLAGELPGVGAARLMADMDAWGYSFREGSTGAWFEGDAVDARRWLARRGLLDPDGKPLPRPVFEASLSASRG